MATRKNVSVDLLRGVGRAGGTVEKLIPRLVIAVVSASDEGFSDEVARVRGARSVAPELPGAALSPLLNFNPTLVNNCCLPYNPEPINNSG